MAPKVVDRDSRRADVLAAAVRVFARKGFAAARIDDVAEEAGISKGSVYLSYDSRDDLLTAAFDSYAARSQALLRRAQESEGPALERLVALVHSVLELVAGEPDLARVLLDLWGARRSGDGMPMDMPSVYRDYRAAITGLLREGVTEGTVRADAGERHATVVVGAVEGCVLQWLLAPELPLTELADPIVELCVGSLRAQRGREDS